MRINRRVAALCAATALTMLSASTAHADLVYNDLDAEIDSALETMNLSYDSSTSTGSSGTTTLRIQIQGHQAGDHPGCNIQGGAHYIGLSASSSNPAVAAVSLPADSRFDSCSDSIVVTVTALDLGTSDVTFAINESNTSNDPHLTFSLAEAAFRVNVTEGTGGGSTCDADPAAPAWAAAILQANGFKPNSGGFKNYVSRVAGAMTEGAVFAGIVKNAHPDYENAVLDYLRVQTGQPGLVMGSRPGWQCTPIG